MINHNQNTDKANVVDLKTKEQIILDAAGWLIKQEEGFSQTQQVEFEDWLNQSELHKKLFNQVAKPVTDANMLANLAPIFPYQKRQQRRKTSLLPKMAVALSTVFCVGLLWFMQTAQTPAPSANQSYQDSVILDAHNSQTNTVQYVRTFHTQIGEQGHFILPDQSSLRLNTNSQVKVVFTDNRRLLYLNKGELHIEVAHNQTWPLSVIAKDKTFEAVGTAFNVAIENELAVELIVTDGTVAVAEIKPVPANQNQPDNHLVISVNKGEKLQLSTEQNSLKNAQKVQVGQAQIDQLLAWQTGSLTFNGEPLETVLQTLAQYTEYRFELEQAELKQMKIVARIKVSELNNITEILTHNFGLKAEKTKDKQSIVLSKAKVN
ncbi:FecR domain-containing protein [Catenovulum sp. 2E275]|uniref:FecR family protein n=1 Tax=Catenovulum sp. 2E275 TaxID=2980497 RepID=UPI0021D0095C|nr:FecR family protein [Catenovulum sp. 2E275]MCU4676546.1 FecR domain-containing protein [Catenovulum sp. 2E275]